MKRLMIKHGDQLISSNIRYADSFFLRLMGYMFKPRPSSDDGILFEPGNSIHTFFMLFNLDIVFMKNDGTVVKIIRDLKPWRMTWFYPSSKRVLELPSGTLPLDVKEGSKLEVINV